MTTKRNIKNRNYMFGTNPTMFYSDSELSMLYEMISNLYRDRTWTIVEKNTGVYITSDNLEIHYMDFCTNWLIPSIFGGIIETVEDEEKHYFPYKIDNDLLDTTDISFLFKPNSIITELYDQYENMIKSTQKFIIKTSK